MQRRKFKPITLEPDRFTCAGLLAISLYALAFSLPAAAVEDLNRDRLKTTAQYESLTTKLKLSEARRKELAGEIKRLEKDRATLNRALIETTARTRELEQKIEAGRTRLIGLEEEESGVRASLKTRRALLIEVLAALQRMGRNPPPALLVRPEDALSSVRSAILLGAVVPEVRAETEVLIADLQELVRIRGEIRAQINTQNANLTSLSEDETRLSLLLEEKSKKSRKSKLALEEEQKTSARIATEAKSLKGLIAKLEKSIDAAERAAKAARKADERRRKEEEKRLEQARSSPDEPVVAGRPDPGRISPALAFAKALNSLPRPVNGVEIQSFGDNDGFGGTSKGLSIATRINSRVIAPSDSWVVYAGPFRAYGQLIILNAGEKHHVVLAGMDAINVSIGQFVLAGEPIAVMGAPKVAATANADIGAARPVLYVEFRKDDTPIDPTPWWATGSAKRQTNDS
ncbi:MAG: peptidoglycan DD-metalloendopeptidase family protein [Pseudomonadota bacterium]